MEIPLYQKTCSHSRLWMMTLRPSIPIFTTFIELELEISELNRD